MSRLALIVCLRCWKVKNHFEVNSILRCQSRVLSISRIWTHRWQKIVIFVFLLKSFTIPVSVRGCYLVPDTDSLNTQTERCLWLVVPKWFDQHLHDAFQSLTEVDCKLPGPILTTEFLSPISRAKVRNILICISLLLAWMKNYLQEKNGIQRSEMYSERSFTTSRCSSTSKVIVAILERKFSTFPRNITCRQRMLAVCNEL